MNHLELSAPRLINVIFKMEYIPALSNKNSQINYAISENPVFRIGMFWKSEIKQNTYLDVISSQVFHWIFDFEIIMYNNPEHSGDAQFIEK